MQINNNMFLQAGKSIAFSDLYIMEISAQCRYLQDCVVNGVKSEQDNLLFPKQCIINDNTIYFRIDIKQKLIINWLKGNTAKTFFKIVDGFSALIYNKNNDLILKYDTNYVPNNVDFDGKGYGDYLEFNIDKDGYITNWDDKIFFHEMKDCDYEIV